MNCILDIQSAGHPACAIFCLPIDSLRFLVFFDQSMNLPISQIITTGISVSALCLGVLNFVMARQSEKKKIELQKRNDQLEVERLLERCWIKLYGPDGYSQTGDQSKFDEAEAAVEQAEFLDSKNPRIARYRGLLYEVKGNFAGAKEMYQKSIELNPRYAVGHDSLGCLLEGEEGVARFKIAIEYDPKNGWPHFHLARLLQKMGQMAEATEHFQKAVDLQPKKTEWLNALAWHLVATKRRDEARTIYEKVISLDPSNVDAMVGLGRIIAEGGNWEEGIAWIEDAMRMKPKDSYPYKMLAALYADKKQPEQALQYYEKAVQLDPTCRLSTDSMHELAAEMKKILMAPEASESQKAAKAQAGAGQSS